MNIGFFDVTNDIPIELIFKGEEYKNKKIEALQKYKLIYDLIISIEYIYIYKSINENKHNFKLSLL